MTHSTAQQTRLVRKREREREMTHSTARQIRLVREREREREISWSRKTGSSGKVSKVWFKIDKYIYMRQDINTAYLSLALSLSLSLSHSPHDFSS